MTKGNFIVADPPSINVYDRVMCDVDRIRDITKELADFSSVTAFYLAACAQIYNQWEDENDDQ